MQDYDTIESTLDFEYFQEVDTTIEDSIFETVEEGQYYLASKC